MSEFDQFCKVLRDEKIKSYLEIGCWTGGTISLVATYAMPRGRIVAVDKPFKPSKEKDLRLTMNQWKQKGHDAHLFIGDSGDPKIIAAVKDLGPFDAVFIDGDHRLEAVTRDWENYGPLGRIVGFHDIARDMPQDEHGGPHRVATFWNGFKNNYRHVEFISESSKAGLQKGAFGIGVVWRQ